MRKRHLLLALTAAMAAGLSAPVWAQDVFKIGLLLPLTGPFASTGKQLEAAAKLYIAQNGDMVGGKKVQLVIKDDTGVAEIGRAHV